MIKIGVVNGDVIEAGGVKNVTNNYYGKDNIPVADKDLHVAANGNESKEENVNVNKKISGPRRKFLFPENGNDAKENIEVKNREKERLCNYLSKHCLKSRKLVCTKSDTLNKTIACFLLKWIERGMTSENPSSGAIFRFLTGDCGIVSEVEERSYGNRVKEWIKDKNGYDTAVMLMVKDSFK